MSVFVIFSFGLVSFPKYELIINLYIEGRVQLVSSSAANPQGTQMWV